MVEVDGGDDEIEASTLVRDIAPSDMGVVGVPPPA